MDDMIDNLPGAISKKGYCYLDNDDKFDDVDIFGTCDNNHPSPFYNEIKQPENPFVGTDDFNEMPHRGLESMDDSFGNLIRRSSNFSINYNYDQLERVNNRQQNLVETPSSNMMNKDMMINSPTNQLA
jgi:hypothetical protein